MSQIFRSGVNEAADQVRCIIHLDDPTGQAAAANVYVNGRSYPIVINTPFLIDPAGYDALAASTLNVELLPPEDASPGSPEADGGAAGGSGGPSGGTDDFDPEAVISGTIPVIEERLAGLTPEQLALVEAAENDREVSRKGVLELLAKAREAANPPAETE